MADSGILLDCLMLFIIFVIGPPLTIYWRCHRFQTFINTKLNDLRSAYPRILESMYMAILLCLLVIPLCSISFGIAAWKFLLNVRWRSHLRKIWGVLSDIRIITASSQASKLQAELSKQKDALNAEHLAREGKLQAGHLARESNLRAEHSAETIILRNQLTEQERMATIARQRSLGSRLSCKQSVAKILRPPSAATACPGIFVPDVVARATAKKTAEQVSNSTQTAEVKPAYVHATTNTSPQTPAGRHASSSISRLMTVQIQPQDQQPIATKSASLSFSSIMAVHTIVPGPAHKRPAIETTDAGSQADSTGLVSRDELDAQAERHAYKIAAVEQSADEKLAAQKREHDIEINKLNIYYSSELDALKAQQDRHDDEIATIRSSYTSEVAAHKTTKDELRAREGRHASDIAVLKSSHDSDRQEQLRAQKERHDAEIADVRLAYSNEISTLKSSQSSNVVAAREKLALYEQEGIRLQTMVNSISSSHAEIEARVQSRDVENARLNIELEAANVKVAAGASQEAVEEYVQDLRNGYQHKLEEKDKDMARLRKGMGERVTGLEAALKTAEGKAKECDKLRHEKSILEGKVNKGTWPGLPTPSNGSMKNSAALKAELELITAKWEKAFGAAEHNGAQLVACERDRLAAVARADAAETELSRYKKTVMPTAPTNAVAGMKRGAEDEMSSGVGKRARE